MDPRWRSSLILALSMGLFLPFVQACFNGAPLRDHANYVEENAERLHDAALRCDAERQIAMAESHLDFAQYEMQRGNFLPARRHIEVALENIEAVDRIVGDRPECFGIEVVTDTDGDGILDEDDNCVYTPNPDQTDQDEDGIGDACDDDIDGDTILNDDDNCVYVPNTDQVDADGDGVGDACDESVDRDGDGILDPDDACPDDPEDIDGFEDFDGCPEDDNDLDGILDLDDACPDIPEDFDGDEDEDGCPDESSLVIVTDTMIEITQQINFELDSATITGDVSFQILSEVGGILRSNDEMEIRIEGHTDSQGSSSYNLRLSQDRADSVRDYLISLGIEPSRLEAVGFGEERPIDDNSSEEGRANNRRVEFHITRR